MLIKIRGKSSCLFQAEVPSVLVIYFVLNSALRKYSAQIYINREPIPLPMTKPHQAPAYPILKIKASKAANRGVKIVVLRRVAIRELRPFPASWKKEEEKRPSASMG